MAAPRRSRRAERTEETKQELVDAATRVFAREGFHGASLEQIVSEAGYSTGAIYGHFGGKDELFLAAFDAYALTRVGELTAIDAAEEGPLPARARAFADHWMERQAGDPSFMVIALEFLAHAWRRPALRDAMATRHAAVRLALGRFIEKAARNSEVELPMPAQDIATALREMGVGLALVKLTDPGAFPDRLFGDFVELFFELATKAQAPCK